MKSPLFLSLAVSAAFCFAPANAQTYTFKDLSPGAAYSTLARAINNAGQVVGDAYTSAGNLDPHATLWSGASMVDLGTFGGTYSGAAAINNSGVIAGASSVNEDTVTATVWHAGGGSAASPASFGPSAAMAINNHGQVAGWSADADAPQAVVWNGSTATVLPTLGGYGAFAYGINDSGTVVGKAPLSDGSGNHATLWTGSGVTDLGTLGGADSAAQAINAGGAVVGYALSDDGTMRAVRWNSNGISDLGSLGGDSGSALAINSHGQIVGYSLTADYNVRATLWDGARIIDLNEVLDPSVAAAGWVLGSAQGINDDGAIVGNAYNTITGQTHAFLLSVSAVPEPATYLLLMSGLGLVGWAGRRRKV